MNWQHSAPCASIGGDYWFPEDAAHGVDAKKICNTCPYKAPCLLGALERGETAGIWGGVPARQFRPLQIQLGLKPNVVPAQHDNGTCPAGHEPEEIHIKPNGKRQCRACNRDQVRRSRAKRRLKLAGAPTMRRALDEAFADEAGAA